MIRDTDHAWAAGFIDGEGTIGLYTKGKNTSPVPTLRVSNTDPRPLEKLQRLFGGWVKASPPKLGNRRPQFFWVLQGSAKIQNVLEAILPYLCVKEKQAALVLGWIKYLMHPDKIRQASNVELDAMRIAYVQQIRILNKTGLSA